MLDDIKKEKRLKILEETFKQAYNSIVITTPNVDYPQFIYVNPAFTRITGYESEEVKGKTPKILQGRETDRATIERLKTCLREGKFFQGSTVNYRKDGSSYWVEWNITPIRDDNEEIIFFLSIQQDITERKKLERELYISTKRFEALFHKLIQKLKLDIDELKFYKKFKHIFERDLEQKNSKVGTRELVIFDFILRDDLQEILDINDDINFIMSDIYQVGFDSESLNTLLKYLKRYSEILNQYREISEITKSFDKFISILESEREQVLNLDSEALSLIDAVILNLYKWVRAIFIDGCVDFHFLDDSFKSDVDAIEAFLVDDDDDDDDVMLF